MSLISTTRRHLYNGALSTIKYIYRTPTYQKYFWKKLDKAERIWWTHCMMVISCAIAFAIYIFARPHTKITSKKIVGFTVVTALFYIVISNHFGKDAKKSERFQQKWDKFVKKIIAAREEIGNMTKYIIERKPHLKDNFNENGIIILNENGTKIDYEYCDDDFDIEVESQAKIRGIYMHIKSFDEQVKRVVC